MFYPTTNTLIKLYEMLVDQRYQTFFNKKIIEDNELALYACIEVSCNNFGYERDGNTYHEEWEAFARYYLHFIIHKHHRVYQAVTTERVNFKKLNSLEWTNISNHDSCYKSSIESEVSKYYFKAHEVCWEPVEKKHSLSPAEADINVSLHDLFSPLFRFITVKRKALPETSDNYRDTITNIEEFSVKFIPSTESTT